MTDHVGTVILRNLHERIDNIERSLYQTKDNGCRECTRLSLSLRARHAEGRRDINHLMSLTRCATHLGQTQLEEIYSRPRATDIAGRIGVENIVALDLSVLDPLDGFPWDSSSPHRRQRATERPLTDTSFLLPRSHMQNAFCHQHVKTQAPGEDDTRSSAGSGA